MSAIGTVSAAKTPALTRWYRPTMLGLALIIVAAAAVIGWVAWSHAAGLGRVCADLTLYIDATREWFNGTSFYPERQLAGPYTISDGDILYPPTTIPLFALFLVLPAVLFFAIPMSITAAVVIHHRPAPWTWPLMALCLAFPPTMIKIAYGNPFMWCAAAVAAGTIYGWPGVLVLLKPSLAPLALTGARHHSWWVALAGFGVVALAFAPMWGDYLTAIANSRNAEGLLYSLSDVPYLLLPVIAWQGRSRPRHAADLTPSSLGSGNPGSWADRNPIPGGGLLVPADLAVLAPRANQP